MNADQKTSLTFISTGSVQARTAMVGQPIQNRNITMRRLRSFADRTWTDPMPIGVFVINHPDGPILFDTGESPLCNDPGYLPIWSPTRMFARTRICAEDGIVAQLLARGVEPAKLQAIVLSHLHGDHTGGLQHILELTPDVPVYLSHSQWKAFGENYWWAMMQGCTPQHWPKNFAPRLLDFEDGSVGPWNTSSNITADGCVVAVPTPGHVPGHVSLVVYETSTWGAPRYDNDSPSTSATFLLLGDASYSVDLLDREEPDGVNDDPEMALQSLRLVKQFASLTDLVVLPSHDINTPTLLRDRVVYKPGSNPSS
jgi:glyoxylase-like metal-dependent hydrolase (beta-lactamase superfamily II)